MNRSDLIALLEEEETLVQNVDLKKLSGDELLCLKFTLEANNRLMKGLSEKRRIQFQKQSKCFFIERI